MCVVSAAAAVLHGPRLTLDYSQTRMDTVESECECVAGHWLDWSTLVGR